MPADYKKLYMLSGDAVVGVDGRGRIAFANPAAASFFGCSPEGERAAKFLPEHLLQETGDSFVSSTVINGRSVCVSAVRSESILVISISAPPSDDGAAWAARNIVTSINSALGTLRMAADKLVELLPEDDKRALAYSSALYHSYYIILRLARNVALIGAFAEHRAVFSPVNTEIVQFCADMSDAAAHFVRASGIELEFESSVEQLYANVDREKIVQLMMNLISNSMAHTPSGGRITVAVRKMGDKLVLSVADNGSGIPADVMPTVFSRFKQELGLSELAKGTGLGLTISRGIAELHGGVLVIESREGVGTSVRVMLPTDNPLPTRFAEAKTEYEAGNSDETLTELSGTISSEFYSKKYLD